MSTSIYVQNCNISHCLVSNKTTGALYGIYFIFTWAQTGDFLLATLALAFSLFATNMVSDEMLQPTYISRVCRYLWLLMRVPNCLFVGSLFLTMSFKCCHFSVTFSHFLWLSWCRLLKNSPSIRYLRYSFVNLFHHHSFLSILLYISKI